MATVNIAGRLCDDEPIVYRTSQLLKDNAAARPVHNIRSDFEFNPIEDLHSFEGWAAFTREEDVGGALCLRSFVFSDNETVHTMDTVFRPEDNDLPETLLRDIHIRMDKLLAAAPTPNTVYCRVCCWDFKIGLLHNTARIADRLKFKVLTYKIKILGVLHGVSTTSFSDTELTAHFSNGALNDTLDCAAIEMNNYGDLNIHRNVYDINQVREFNEDHQHDPENKYEMARIMILPRSLRRSERIQNQRRRADAKN